jgi:hypothetical protein
MRCLSGDPGCEESIFDELSVVGVPIVVAEKPSTGEVPARRSGRLELPGRVVTFVRAGLYWMIEAKPPLSLAKARRINDLPHDGPRGHYCGNEGTLGDVARVEGFAGGHAPLKWKRTRSVGSWDVDTLDGLYAFVRALREACG